MKKTVKIVADSICEELDIKQTCRFLKQRDNFLILCHATPDGDTLGSAYALAMGLTAM